MYDGVKVVKHNLFLKIGIYLCLHLQVFNYPIFFLPPCIGSICPHLPCVFKPFHLCFGRLLTVFVVSSHPCLHPSSHVSQFHFVVILTIITDDTRNDIDAISMKVELSLLYVTKI